MRLPRFFLLTAFASIYTDRLWYKEVGYGQVFTKMLWTRVGLFLGFGALMAAIVAVNMHLAHRYRPMFRMAPADASGKRMLVTREPLGCVLSIVPWNAPSTLCMRAIVNPLAAGNVVVLKTSEHSPKIHSAIARVFIDAGLPAGVLNVIHVSPQDAPAVTKALIEEEFVRKVNFTGSTRIGRIIARLCAENLKPVVLELGGKAPVIVTQEADIAVAANNVVWVFGSLLPP